MDHWALLMMKDPEPQLLQAVPLPTISQRRYHARYPETYMLADYWYCCCEADPASPVSPAPASWPPEPEEPPGTGTEEKVAARGSSSDSWVFDAGGSDATGADATGSDPEGSEAAAKAGEAEAAGTDAPPARSALGMPEPVPFLTTPPP